nr:MAG TPA: hypothetical protein [Caudoviricetes sp.]
MPRPKRQRLMPRKQRPKPKPCASTTLNVLPVY